MLELSGRHSLPRAFQLLAVPRALERKLVAKIQTSVYYSGNSNTGGEGGIRTLEGG